MRILITAAAGPRRRWQALLAEGLAVDGHRVVFATGEAAHPVPGLELLLRLERLIAGPDTGRLFARDDAAPPAASPADGHDLEIDLAATATATDVPRWRVLFDGVPGETGLVAALLEGRAPAIAIVDASGGLVAAGTPALERPRLVGAGLDAVLARTVGLCRKAARDRSRGLLAAAGPPVFAAATAITPGLPATFRFGVAGLAAKIAGRLRRMAGGGHQWQTGWRRLDPTGGDGVQACFGWPGGGYGWLPDDGQRFYADPFIFTHGGHTMLFVEEFPYATGRGLISAVEMTPAGPAGPPRPVLERPYHLSYPSVFARDGTIWMIPETSGNGTIELYRADPFPHRWTLDRVLIDNVAAGDATLHEHGGRLYLFATTNDDGGSTWDQLSIFHAPTLSGPWSPHAANPVLIDAGAARPAGFPFARGAATIRPAQDCLGGYGAGLSFCRIDRLGPDDFAQTVVGKLGPDPRWRASGAHTLNVGSGFEVIDRIGPHRSG